MRRITIPIKGTDKFASVNASENVDAETIDALSNVIDIVLKKLSKKKLKEKQNKSL